MATYKELLEERRKKRGLSSSSLDPSTLEGLRKVAESQGFDLQKRGIDEEDKLSVLQRITRGLSALEPANAIYQSRYEGKAFATEYVKDIFQELGSAVTGREMQDEGKPKKTFKDILVKEGMKDREGKIDLADVAGFFGDVFLDPGTYAGGAIAKGIGKGITGTAKIAEKVGTQIAPRATQAARGLFDAAKDAGGRAFVFGYGTSQGLSDDLVGFVNDVSQKGSEQGIKYQKLFSDLSAEGKDDLVEGLTKFRGDFGKKRAELIEHELKKNSGQMNKEIRDAVSKEGKTPAASTIKTIKDSYEKEAFKKVNKQLVQEFEKIAPEFKNVETVKFFTKTLLPELQKSQKAYANIRNIAEDEIMSVYFPFISKSTTKGFNNAVRVSSKGYNKAFKGILEKDEIITDPVEAYATRAFQVEKDLMTQQQLKSWVDTYGAAKNTYKNSQEALKDGFVAIREQGIRGKVVGYLKENDAKFIKELYDPSFKVINDLAKATGFDAVTNLFKKSVTGLFPAFHARNYVSGMIQNYETLGLQALNPATLATAKAVTYKMLRGQTVDPIRIGEKLYTHDEIIKPFMRKFGISSQYISDFGGEAIEDMLKKKGKWNPFTYTRAVGNYVEGQQKMAAYLTALKKGYSKEQSLKFAEQAGFDYSKLTSFEKNVLRRLIPFYSFGRKNLELQMKTLAKNPERLGVLTKMGTAAGTPTGLSEDERTIPDWMRNRFMASFGESAYGLPQVLSGFGTPIEQQAELFEKGIMGVLSQLNPLIRVPMERATGKDFFRERDLKEIYDAKEYGEAPKFLKDWLQIEETQKPIYKGGKDTGEVRTVYIANPKRLQIARAMFTSRGFTFLHTLFGDSELDTKGRILKTLTGVKPYELDEEATKYFEDLNNYRDILDFLSAMGITKEFKKAYIPK